MKKLVLARRLSQVFFLSLFIYILWSTRHADIFFKIDPLVSIFTSIGARQALPGIMLSIAMLVMTFVLGRFFCGWVCPLGAIIDICGTNAKNRDLNPRQVKYYILGFIFICAVLGVQIAWVFDPIVITARFISLNFIPSLVLVLDKTFVFIIKGLNFYSPLYDFYRSLKSSLLGVKIYYFSHASIAFIFFIIICGLAAITRRFWCRMLCPLGALYALAAKSSLLRRYAEKCSKCLRCRSECRMGAIKEDISYRKEECILCMDCIYDCPTHGTRFAWSIRKATSNAKGAISRKDFLFLILSSIFLLGFRNRDGVENKNVIRPPGVLSESEFLNKCIRCGNCMKVCPTNGLQPVMFESGLNGVWTPHLVPEIGYCEYNCNLCGNACPTGAIPKLSVVEKQGKRLGLAGIDRTICVAWAQNKECIVCEEHCPVSGKAVKVYKEAGILKPYIDSSLCIGCGICQNKCPTRPLRAIRVKP